MFTGAHEAALFPSALNPLSSHWERRGGQPSLLGGGRISGGSTGRSCFEHIELNHIIQQANYETQLNANWLEAHFLLFSCVL